MKPNNKETEASRPTSPAELVASLWEERRKVFLLLFLSTGLALSEGLSIGLLVPILEANAATSSFNNVPGFREILSLIEDIPVENRVYVLAGMLGAAVLIRGGMMFGAQYFTAVLPLDIQCRLMRRVYSALLESNFNGVSDYDSGQLRNLLTEQPQRAAAVVQALAGILTSILIMSVYGALMLAISWQMTLVAIVFIGLGYLLMRTLSGPWFAWSGQRLTERLSAVHKLVGETIDAMPLIKTRNAESLMGDRYVDSVASLRHVERKRHFYTVLQSPVFTTATGLFICGLLVIGSFLFEAENNAWMSKFLLFVICLYRLSGPGTQLITYQAHVSMNLHAFETISAFVANAKRTRIPDGDIAFTELKNTITFDHIGVTYGGRDRPALDDVSFTINRGQMLALAGPSGAGKTSVVSLLMRLRDPSSGQILVDENDLRHLKLNTWRQKISIVSQEIVLFDDTVRNNLTFGLTEIDDAKIWDALRFANAEDFVNEMRGKLDERVGEKGATLSGGQKQRLALARAILAEPEILVFDEATSQLDSIAEAAIQKAIEQTLGKVTLIVIAHRLSTVKQADNIIVMDQGKIIESGTFDRLMTNRGMFHELVKNQKL